MASVAELVDRVAELEMRRAQAWSRYRDLDQELLEANASLRDAAILAARDPVKSAALAGLATTQEIAAQAGEEPARRRPVRPSSIAAHD